MKRSVFFAMMAVMVAGSGGMLHAATEVGWVDVSEGEDKSVEKNAFTVLNRDGFILAGDADRAALEIKGGGQMVVGASGVLTIGNTSSSSTYQGTLLFSGTRGGGDGIKGRDSEAFVEGKIIVDRQGSIELTANFGFAGFQGGGGILQVREGGGVIFNTDSSFLLTGQDNAGDPPGDLTVNNAGTVTFASGTTLTVDPKDSVLAFNNNGTLTIDATNTWLQTTLLGNDILKNKGLVILDGTLAADVVPTTFAATDEGRVQIAVNGDGHEIQAFDAGGNSLLISPAASAMNQRLHFSNTITATNQSYDGATYAIRIGDNAFVAIDGAVIAANGDLVIGTGANVVFGDAVSVTGAGGIAISGAVVTFGGDVKSAGALSIAEQSTVTFDADVDVAGGGCGVSGCSTMTIGGAVTGDVTVTGSTIATNNAGSVTGTLTIADGGTLFVGNDGGSIDALDVTGDVAVMKNTRIAINRNATTIAPGDVIVSATNSFTVTGGTLSGFVAALNTIGGSAIQAISYREGAGDKSIEIASYRLLNYADPADAARSMANSAKNMAALGVANAASMVDYSFGGVLFKVAQGENDGDTLGGTVPGIAVAKTDPAYAAAATTWSTLRTFANMGGGCGGISGIAASSMASAMTGQNQAAVVGSAFTIAGDNINGVNNRIAANNLARAENCASDTAFVSAMRNCDFANRFWVGGLGMRENAGSRGPANGYTLNTWGTMLGYDRIFGPITFGGAFGYSRGTFEEKNVLANDSKINNYAFNLYATYNHRSGFFASLIGGYAYSGVKLRRSLSATAFESAEYHVNTWAVGGSTGYDWRPLPNLTITPRAGLYYLRAKSGSIVSSYTSINEISDSLPQLPIDLSIAYRVPLAKGGITLAARGGYAYNFNNNGADGVLIYNNIVGIDPVSIKGRTPGRHTWNVGGGVKYQAGRFDIGIDYDYYAKASYHAHRVTGVFGVRF